MPTYELQIDNPSINGITGHHQVQVRILEYDDEGKLADHGIMEVYGIDSLALERRFDSSLEKWLGWVAQEMLYKHKSRRTIQDRLLTMDGRRIKLIG